ncbi:hypothetical protein V495_01044 [Pseudogymnoascus sp. VKM F-4514 (FW-929)]|nr:hypothetical protein V495_01044 [Pseudogymnoascus sp. VKM F-4514 (FW-929)]
MHHYIFTSTLPFSPPISPYAHLDSQSLQTDSHCHSSVSPATRASKILSTPQWLHHHPDQEPQAYSPAS